MSTRFVEFHKHAQTGLDGGYVVGELIAIERQSGLETQRVAAAESARLHNASNAEKDVAWVRNAAAGFDAEVVDRCADYGQLALQGTAVCSLSSPSYSMGMS